MNLKKINILHLKYKRPCLFLRYQIQHHPILKKRVLVKL